MKAVRSIAAGLAMAGAFTAATFASEAGQPNQPTERLCDRTAIVGGYVMVSVSICPTTTLTGPASGR